MKHFSTLLLAMFAIGASAQSGGTGALLDETYQFTDGGDGLFRYVFAYDSNKQRSSETIYYKERNAGVWGSESLYEVGNYSYQFDSKGRLKVKEVKYSLGKPEFQTYRIMVDYNDTAAAGEAVSTFKRYTLADDNNYQLEEQWSLYANGSPRIHFSTATMPYRTAMMKTERLMLFSPTTFQAINSLPKSQRAERSTIPPSFITRMDCRHGQNATVTTARRVGLLNIPHGARRWTPFITCGSTMPKDASCSTNITLTAQTTMWIIRLLQPCRASAERPPACRS